MATIFLLPRCCCCCLLPFGVVVVVVAVAAVAFGQLLLYKFPGSAYLLLTDISHSLFVASASVCVCASLCLSVCVRVCV